MAGRAEQWRECRMSCCRNDRRKTLPPTHARTHYALTSSFTRVAVSRCCCWRLTTAHGHMQQQQQQQQRSAHQLAPQPCCTVTITHSYPTFTSPDTAAYPHRPEGGNRPGATENAGLENPEASYRGGKRETSRYGTPKLQVE